MHAPKWQLPLIVALISVFLWLISPILPPFVLAILLAWLGNPMVERLERAGRSRNTAVLLVFSLFALIGVLAILVFVPLMWQQLIQLMDGLPNLVVWFQSIALPWVESKLHKDIASMLDPTHTVEAIKQHWKEIGSMASVVLGYASKSGVAFLVFLSNLLLLPILSFYFLRDWPKFLKQIREILPRALEPKIVQLANESNEVLGGFLRGQLLVMLSLGCIYALGLWLVGLDSGLLIGFIAGLVSFVPYLGATVGIIAAIIASLIQHGDITHLLLVGVVFMVGQTIESFVLTPWLVGDRIGLHPVAVIFAIMAGGQLFGFVGILVALPSAAVINVLYKHAHVRYIKSRIYGQLEPIPVEPERPDV